MPSAARLGLGGHTFISELGSDPLPTSEEQCQVVAACLDAGITLVDTTYYQERVALGEVLARLGRRAEVEIMAWNFFRTPGRVHELVPFRPYSPDDLDVVLAELRTDHVDSLVIHTHDDTASLHRELELARRWQGEGKARRVALGMVRLEHLEALPASHPVSAVLAPYNAFHRDAEPAFRRARELGMTTIALPPFIRGRKLAEVGADREVAASLLLRWVAFQPIVDYVVVAMRRPEWVAANLSAVARGPLTPAEAERVEEWASRG